jgi:hypothetical protein
MTKVERVVSAAGFLGCFGTGLCFGSIFLGIGSVVLVAVVATLSYMLLARNLFRSKIGS